MNYAYQLLGSRKTFLQVCSMETLHDIAGSYFDLEHGVGGYSREELINMVLEAEFKVSRYKN